MHGWRLVGIVKVNGRKYHHLPESSFWGSGARLLRDRCAEGARVVRAPPDCLVVKTLLT